MKKLLKVSVAIVMIMTLSLSAMASNIVKSSEIKPGPPVPEIEVIDIMGEKVDVPLSNLVVTPISESKEAAEDIKVKLDNAKEQIEKVEVLTELSSDLETTIPEGMVAEDLVVRDLIDVSVVGEAAEILKAGGSIAARFELGVDPDEFLAVLHNYDADLWETIPEDRITKHENGDVTVLFTSLSPVAFVVGRDSVSIDEEGPNSPATAEIADSNGSNAAVTAICGIACIAVGLTLLAVLLKKKA